MTAGVRLLANQMAVAAPLALAADAGRRLQQAQQTAVVAMTTAQQRVPDMPLLAPSHSFHAAQHLPVALPGKSAWLGFLVAVHLCALAYWAYAFFVAQRWAT